MFDKKEYMKKYYIENKDEVLECQRKYYENNCEGRKEYSRQYHKDNREEMLEQMKQWRRNNIKKINKYKKQYYLNNHEEILGKSKQYQKNNIGKVLEYQKNYKKIRNKIDLGYNLNNKIRRAMNRSLKSNKAGKHWETLVDYSLADLIKRLKRTMPKGYCWQDVLDGKLHIDHIIPKSIFNFTKSEHIDFKRCWALSNLQLLLAKENMSKSNKLSRPFQPALLF